MSDPTPPTPADGHPVTPFPPITQALFVDDEALALELMERSSDPMERGGDGYSSFHMACSRGHARAVEFLLGHGADPNAADDAGFTPLIHAARSGCLPVVDALLAAGADMHASTPELGYTPLIRAAEYGDVHVIARLLDAGVAADDAPPGHMTALMTAAEHGDLDVLRLLLERGADAGREHDGRQASAYASDMGHADAKELLSRAALRET